MRKPAASGDYLVGLCKRLLGKNTPNLNRFLSEDNNCIQMIDPVSPAVTCSAQSTYLTGKILKGMEL